MAGIGAVLFVAGAGAIAYSVASSAQDARHASQLSSQVQSVQTVGIIGQVGTSVTDHAGYRQLVSSATGPRFGPMPPASLAQGDPQWSADTMAGGTFVFIYAPDGKCLAASTRQGHPVLALRRCNLGAGQRWQRFNAAVASDGHLYGQYRNLSTGRCLAAGGAPGTSSGPAALVPCAAPATHQLISLWWAA
jgi:hypothetical protein